MINAKDLRMMKELGLPTILMKEMSRDSILDKNILYTINYFNNQNICVDMNIGVSADIQELIYSVFKIPPNIKIIYYPLSRTTVNGNIDISRDLICIHGHVYHLQLLPHIKSTFNIILKRGNPTNLFVFPQIDFFNDLIRYLGRILCNVKAFIEIGKHVSLEWSYGSTINTDYSCNDSTIKFYDFNVTD